MGGAATKGVKGGYWYFNQIRFFAPLRPVMRTGSSGLSFGTWYVVLYPGICMFHHYATLLVLFNRNVILSLSLPPLPPPTPPITS